MKKGFTLIELLVVIMIIGILAVALAPAFNKVFGKNENTTENKITIVPIDLEKPEKTPEQIAIEQEQAKQAYSAKMEKNKQMTLEKEKNDCHLTRLCEVDGYTIYSVYDMAGGGTKVIAIPKPVK